MIAVLHLFGCVFQPDVEPSVYCSDVCAVNPYLWGESDVAACTADCIADPNVTQELLNCLWDEDVPNAATMGFRLAICEDLLGLESTPDTGADDTDDTDDTDVISASLTVQLSGDVPEGATVAVVRLYGNVGYEFDPTLGDVVATTTWAGPTALELPVSADGWDAYYYVHAVQDGFVVAAARQVPVYEEGWSAVEVAGPDDVHAYDPAEGVVLEPIAHTDAFSTPVAVPSDVLASATRVATRGPTEGSTPLGTRPYDDVLPGASFTLSWSGDADPARFFDVPYINRAAPERIVAYTDDGDGVYEPNVDPIVGQSCLGGLEAYAVWFDRPTEPLAAWELTLLGRGSGWGLVTVDAEDYVRPASGEITLSSSCP